MLLYIRVTRVYYIQGASIHRAREAEVAGSDEIRQPEAEVEAAGGGGEAERTEAEAAGGGRRWRWRRRRRRRRSEAAGVGVGGGRWSAAEAGERRLVACAMQSWPPARALNRRPRRTGHPWTRRPQNFFSRREGLVLEVGAHPATHLIVRLPVAERCADRTVGTHLLALVFYLDTQC